MSKKKALEAQTFLSHLKESPRYQRPRFWFLFGYSHFILNDMNAAKIYFEKAINFVTENKNLKDFKDSDKLENLDKNDKLNDDSKSAKNFDDEARMNSRLFLAKIYGKEGRDKEAMEILKIVLFWLNFN